MRKALLVGINRYRIPGAELRGCVNDAKLMARILRRFGFTRQDLTVLTDAAATRSGILQALQALIQGAQPGEVLVYYHSGHGTQVPDKEGDEADRRDEALVPHDHSWRQPLLDDHLGALLKTVPEGVALTVLIDTCFSGTMTRTLPSPGTRRGRFLPSPRDLVAVESGCPCTGQRHTPLRTLVNVDLGHVLLAACQEDETASEDRFGKRVQGAFTAALAEVLLAATQPLSYQAVQEAVTRLLRRWRFAQTPQLEGQAAQLTQPFLAPLA